MGTTPGKRSKEALLSHHRDFFSSLCQSVARMPVECVKAKRDMGEARRRSRGRPRRSGTAGRRLMRPGAYHKKGADRGAPQRAPFFMPIFLMTIKVLSFPNRISG